MCQNIIANLSLHIKPLYVTGTYNVKINEYLYKYTVKKPVTFNTETTYLDNYGPHLESNTNTYSIYKVILTVFISRKIKCQLVCTVQYTEWNKNNIFVIQGEYLYNPYFKYYLIISLF